MTRRELVLTKNRSYEYVTYPTARIYLREGWYSLEDIEIIRKRFTEMETLSKTMLKDKPNGTPV